MRFKVPMIALALAVLSGCSVDPAPKELNPLARWFWVNYDGASDEQVHEAIRNLHALVGNDYTDPLQLTLDRLQPGDDVAPELSGKADVVKARGLFVYNKIKCPIEKIEKMFISLDQDGLHGGYDKYERHYESNVDDYLNRKTLNVLYRSIFTISVLGSEYTAEMPGGTRWIAAEEGASSLGGKAFLTRGYMPKPAAVKKDSDYVRQNYQTQLFYELEPGVVMHMIADWREMSLAGFDSEGDILPSTTLSTLLDGDDDYEDNCK